jgi:hypothetical protein
MSHFELLFRLAIGDQGGAKTVKRSLRIVLAAAVSVAIFGVLVHAVLVAAHLSEPAGTTVQGLTLRRLWATIAALLGLSGVIAGGWLLPALPAASVRILCASRPWRWGPGCWRY